MRLFRLHMCAHMRTCTLPPHKCICRDALQTETQQQKVVWHLCFILKCTNSVWKQPFSPEIILCQKQRNIFIFTISEFAYNNNFSGDGGFIGSNLPDTPTSFGTHGLETNKSSFITLLIVNTNYHTTHYKSHCKYIYIMYVQMSEWLQIAEQPRHFKEL